MIQVDYSNNKLFLSGLKLLVWYCWCLHLHLPQVHLKIFGLLEVFRQSRPFLRKSSMVFDDFLCWFLKILSIALVLMFTQSNLRRWKPFWLVHIFQMDWVNHLWYKGFTKKSSINTTKNNPQEACTPEICSWCFLEEGIWGTSQNSTHPSNDVPRSFSSQSHDTFQGHGHFQLSCFPRHGRWICRHGRGVFSTALKWFYRAVMGGSFGFFL